MKVNNMRRGTSVIVITGLLAAAALLPATSASGSIPHTPTGPYRFRRTVMPAPHRVVAPTGQHITGHPSVLAAVNAARTRRGWSPVAAGNNFAAEACALDASHCNGVQWGGCALTPLPGDLYTATVGTAESYGPRGCVQAISYSAFS